MGLKTTSYHYIAAVPPPANAAKSAGKTLVHKSLYWGHDAQVLFTDWPGSNPAMYSLAVVLVFVLAVFVEWLTHLKFMNRNADDVSTVVMQTAIHAVRTGFSYMGTLSVMSFNGGSSWRWSVATLWVLFSLETGRKEKPSRILANQMVQ